MEYLEFSGYAEMFKQIGKIKWHKFKLILALFWIFSSYLTLGAFFHQHQSFFYLICGVIFVGCAIVSIIFRTKSKLMFYCIITFPFFCFIIYLLIYTLFFYRIEKFYLKLGVFGPYAQDYAAKSTFFILPLFMALYHKALEFWLNKKMPKPKCLMDKIKTIPFYISKTPNLLLKLPYLFFLGIFLIFEYFVIQIILFFLTLCLVVGEFTSKKRIDKFILEGKVKNIELTVDFLQKIMMRCRINFNIIDVKNWNIAPNFEHKLFLLVCKLFLGRFIWINSKTVSIFVFKNGIVFCGRPKNLTRIYLMARNQVIFFLVMSKNNLARKIEEMMNSSRKRSDYIYEKIIESSNTGKVPYQDLKTLLDKYETLQAYY